MLSMNKLGIGGGGTSMVSMQPKREENNSGDKADLTTENQDMLC